MYENDDNPDTPTMGYTIAVISCVNPKCREHAKPRFGGAEPMGSQGSILFCECGRMLAETVGDKTNGMDGVVISERDGVAYAVCDCGAEHRID